MQLVSDVWQTVERLAGLEDKELQETEWINDHRRAAQ